MNAWTVLYEHVCFSLFEHHNNELKFRGSAGHDHKTFYCTDSMMIHYQSFVSYKKTLRNDIILPRLFVKNLCIFQMPIPQGFSKKANLASFTCFSPTLKI